MKNRAALKLKQIPTTEPSLEPDRDAAKQPVRLAPVANDVQPALAPEDDAEQEIEVDGKRIVFTAKNEIVLRCGKSSITLTRAGKIIISGEYVVSRSAGVNRIRGGSVQIN